MTDANGDFRGRIRKALASQKQPTITVLSSLLATQDELGYIPNEAIEEIAASTGESVNEVWGVASFYTNFRFTPSAKHTVEVCWGLSCHLLEAPALLKELLNSLGITGEGDTEDGKITLRYNTCLGACALAPVMSIDHKLYGRLNAEKVRQLIGDLKNDKL